MSVEILAATEEEGEAMRNMAEALGEEVRGVQVWGGPIPPRSFMDMGNGTRMSTPEYFFFRKANLCPEVAVALGCELMSHFRTHLTDPDKVQGEVDFIMFPRCTYGGIMDYLKQVADTPEGAQAIDVLRVARPLVRTFEEACLDCIKTNIEEE